MDLFGDLPPPAPASSPFDSLPRPKAKEESASLGKRGGGAVETLSDLSSKRSKKGNYRFSLKGYHGERRGEREDMQDAHTMIDDFTPQFEALPNNICRVAYYGVFDGHAGPKASEYAAQNLHRKILATLPQGEVVNLGKEMKKCLTEAFKKVDDEFLRKATEAKPTWKDGSTVAAVFVLDDVVYSANLGDSKAVLCRRASSSSSSSSEKKGQLSFVSLTKDHNPSNFEERKRIEKHGGSVRDGRVLGIVEVSRSIGDGRFKHCGLIATPDIFRTQLTENDLFILIACDGLWKVFSVEGAASFIITVLEDESITTLKDDASETNFESKKTTSARDIRYEEACNRLAVEAVKRGCTDNVTVMIVDISLREGAMASENS